MMRYLLPILGALLSSPLRTFAQQIGDLGAIGSGIANYYTGGLQEARLYLSATLAPNATGNTSATSQVYAYPDNTSGMIVTADMYNETDPYGHVLTLNLSKVDLGGVDNNVSTVNKVFELTVSEATARFMAARNLSLTWGLAPTVLVNNSATTTNGSCAGLLGDNCTAALLNYYNTRRAFLPLGSLPACADAAKHVDILGAGAAGTFGFLNATLVPDPTRINAAGFYNQTSPADPEGSFTTRFNQSGYPGGFDFPTRSGLFYYTAPATVADNFTMYDYAVNHYSLIILQERAAGGSGPTVWTAAHCIKADNIAQGSRKPATSGAVGRAARASSLAAVVASAALAALLVQV